MKIQILISFSINDRRCKKVSNEGTSSSVKINHYATINKKQMKALTTLSKEFSCEDLTIKRSGGGLLVCLVSPTEKLTEEE